jgi:hypothetical protein
MSIRVFLSAVSDEFRPYRDQLRSDLTRHNVEVKVQEDFKDLGGDTLDKLDTYIAHCDAVVHLVGEMCGSAPGERERAALLRKHLDLVEEFPVLGDALCEEEALSYTQWEAWLALYHDTLLLTATAESGAPRGPKYAPTDVSRAAQSAHLARLETVRRYPGCAFASPADLAKHIAYTAILDLLVKDYASEAARARDIAEGFIRQMAGKVARDEHLDLDGMKQAVRNALDIYEKEIAGGQTQTNVDAIVDAALARALPAAAASADVTIGTVTSSGPIYIITNSPGANIAGISEKLHLDDVLAVAITNQINGCIVRNVKFRSPYLMAALLQLEQSFASFCLDLARHGYASSAQRVIDKFMAKQAVTASEMGFEPVDLSTDPVMREAARIALNEDADLVDERHVLIALLKSTSGFRARILEDLGSEAFDRLLHSAVNRRSTRRLPTSSELFE